MGGGRGIRDEQALFARQAPGHREGFLVTDGVVLVDDAHVERAGQLVLPNAFDFVGRSLDLVFPLAPPVLRQYRAGRVTRDHSYLLVSLLEVATGASEGATRTRRCYEVGDLSSGLLPQLGACGRVVSFRIGVVIELVGEDGIWSLLRYPLRHHDVIVGMVRRDRRGRNNHLGAECLEQSDFFLRHLVRHREDALVSPQRGRDREADTCVAASAFDDRPAWLQLPLFFSALDNGKSDSVLDRPARIEEFRLCVDRRPDSAHHVIQFDQRRPTNRLQDVVVWLAVPLVFHYRVLLRFVVALRTGLFTVGFAATALAVPALALSGDLMLLLVEESRLMIESPARGGASGCLKNTGNRIDTGTG